MRPAQGLSGLQRVLNSKLEDETLSFSATAAKVQAHVANTDRMLFKAHLEGPRPFLLQAVLHDSRKYSHAAAFLHANLFQQLKRMAKCCPGTSAVSPLYCTLIKLSHAFVKSFPEENQASLLKTDCSMAVLDIKSGTLYTLCFGQNAHLAHVCSELGHAAEPVTVREHIVGNAVVLEAAYTSLEGKHHVVLGSPGLWKHTHPSKAGLHAAAYGAAPHLSTENHHHDAASAIVHSALRSIVDGCAASSSARLRCLHSLSQLDRLPRGSRAESKRGHGVVPRGRGDVHPDITAAVLSFTQHPVAQEGVAQLTPAQRRAQHIAVCPMCAFAARHFLPDEPCSKRPQATLNPVAVSQTCNLEVVSEEHSISSPQSSPILPSSSAGSHQPLDRSAALRPSQRASKGSLLLELSRRLWESVPCPLAATKSKSKASLDSLLSSTRTSQRCYSTDSNSSSIPEVSSHDSAGAQPNTSALSAPLSEKHVYTSKRQEAQRKWKLLRTHVWVSALERGLRRSMWESACTVVLNSAAAFGEVDAESFCSLPATPSSTGSAQSGSVVSDAPATLGSDPVGAGFGGGSLSPLAVLAAH